MFDDEHAMINYGMSRAATMWWLQSTVSKTFLTANAEILAIPLNFLDNFEGSTQIFYHFFL